MSYTQEQLKLRLKTPLGENTLLVRSLRGQESVSAPFHFELELLSDSPDLTLKSLLGEAITISVVLPDLSIRYIHGRVSRFEHGGNNHEGMNFYYAEVVPWVWLLSLSSDCRIFQNMSTQEIVKAVFDEAGFKDYEFRALTEGQTPREYCVQYRETKLNFISRLLEEEGIFYFFEHHEDRHVMVIADASVQFPPYPGLETTHVSLFSDPGATQESILQIHASEELQSSRTALTDYNFEMPKASMLTDAQVSSKYEVFDYPGLFMKRDRGDALVHTRLEEHNAGIHRLKGNSNCRHFTSGYRVQLVGYERSGVENMQVLHTVFHEARQSVTSSVSGHKDESFHYRNSFVMMPYGVPYRPPRVTRKPIISGGQTALVVGKSGEEIWTDKYGRVKVQFYWDRLGKKDENSSCWIRVAQVWAGKNWGSIFIPRIGQEVIIEFLEGDPDRPLIVGRVYNANQMPPYTLPDEQTKTAIKSNSSKGGSGFNELRFEDKKGSEQVFIHAQKNMDVRVLADSKTSVGASKHLTVGGEKDGKAQGNLHVKVFKDQHRHIKGESRAKIEKTLSLIVQGDTFEDYQKNHKKTVKTESYLSAEKVIVEAKSITLNVSGNFIQIDSSGITIVGKKVLINSGGTPVATSISDSALEAEDPAAADNAVTGAASNS